MHRSALAIVAVIIASSFVARGAKAAPSEWVWWEAEKPVSHNFPPKSPFAAETIPQTRNLLSGNDWLSTGGKRGADEIFATYSVDVPADGEYTLWARKFWHHGPFKWRFGNAGDWRDASKVALADETFLRTHLGANWVNLGKVTLTKGKTPFEIRLLAKQGEDVPAAFDCFLLTSGVFIPSGKLKPGEKSNNADPGFFAFEPGIDPFTDDALLDLRHLNEKTAGQSGFLKADRMSFQLGDGTPVRFWAVGVSSGNASQDHQSVDYMARKLAKLGVNMVRFHSGIFAQDDPARVDPKALDNIQYLVSALKREGIYTKLSFYFPLWFEIKPSYGIEGYESIENKKPFALLYFDPRMQAIHRSWMTGLLTTPNPYADGTPLAKDPAVGIVEIINEDSFFFWTFTKKNVPAPHWRKLEQLYTQWLTKRYGSLDKARAAWAGEKAAGDAADHVGLYEAFGMTGNFLKDASAGRRKRVGDQVRFLTETQRDFYASTTKYLKQDLGVGGLISASNWTVADQNLTGALERYTYTAAGVIDTHGYFSGKHEGEGSGYSVRTGHTYQDQAAVLSPAAIPLRWQQVAGHPMIMSELGFTAPNAYRADGIFLSAAYGALQGIDGIFHFALGSNYVRDTSMAKFGLATPATAGTFPASALLYRRGDVTTPDPAVYQVLDLEDLYAIKGSGLFSSDALDELRKADIPEGQRATGAAAVAKVDELASYVGPVVRAFDADTSKSFTVDLSKYIDRGKKTIRSLNGQVQWAYGTGVARVDTPKTQGAAGFLKKAGKIELGDVTIDAGNDFLTVTVTALDDQPLATSKRLLIQAMTEERPYGFKTRGGETKTIEDLGSAPFGVKHINTTVTLKLKGAETPTVTALDENGYATKKDVKVTGGGGRPIEIKLADDALYHVVSR